MADWPTTVPLPDPFSYSFRVQPRSIIGQGDRVKNEVGELPGKLVFVFDIQQTFTEEEHTAFVDWYENTLLNGVLKFNMDLLLWYTLENVEVYLQGATYQSSISEGNNYSFSATIVCEDPPILSDGYYDSFSAAIGSNSWSIGAFQSHGGYGLETVEEFDVAGATYYAVAPSGYSYSSEQDTQYDTRKYTGVLDAVNAITGTLSTPTVINIIGDWSDEEADIGRLRFYNFTADETNYLLLRAVGEARTTGVWDDDKHVLIYNGTIAGMVSIEVGSVRIDGMQITRSYGFDNGSLIFPNSLGSPGILHLSNSVLKIVMPNTQKAISCSDANVTLNVWNCVMYHTDSPINFGAAAVYVTNGVVHLRSCSVHWSEDFGIRVTGGTVTAKNCYVGVGEDGIGQPGVCYSGTITKTNCASEDNSGSDGFTNIPYNNDLFNNTTLGFEDFRLPEGSPLIAVGVDTSGDSAPLGFTNDIAGDKRPF